MPRSDERGRERGLARHGDQVVVRLVQHAASDRELGLQPVELVHQFDGLARHGRGLGRELETEALRPGDVEASLDAHERRELRLRAAGALRLDPREFLLDLRGEAHAAIASFSARQESGRAVMTPLLGVGHVRHDDLDAARTDARDGGGAGFDRLDVAPDRAGRGVVHDGDVEDALETVPEQRVHVVRRHPCRSSRPAGSRRCTRRSRARRWPAAHPASRRRGSSGGAR